MSEYMELLEKLIRCKAVTGDVANVNCAVGVMRDFLEAKGIPCVTEQFEGREILYASTMPGKVQDIMLNAHLDVVPAPDSMFEPSVKDGKMYARGSADCQGNAVVIAHVLCNLRGRASVSAVFSTDEEVGGHTSQAMVERGYKARKAVLILDAAPYSIAHAQKGIIAVTLRATGKGGHSSEPWKLDNPIDRLIDGYVKLRAAWDALPSDHWGDTMAPCIIRGGSAFNQVPDTAEMCVNIRYTCAEDYEKILEKIRSQTGLEIIVNTMCEPVFVDENHPFMQELRQKMADSFGRGITLYRMHGATDARHFAAMNVPVAILGTEGDGLHSACEWVDLQNCRDYAKFLTEFIEKL